MTDDSFPKPLNPDSDVPAVDDATPAADIVADEYKVGPGNPPREKKWRKGCPSPNPKGRPRKDASLDADLKELFEEIFIKRKVPISRDGKQTARSRLAIGLEQLANQFAKGDRYARADVFKYAAQLGIDLTGKGSSLQEALTPNHQGILDAYLSRNQVASADVDEKPRVLAPEDLTDDDVNEK